MRTFLLKTMQAMMLFSICILGWIITNFLEEEKQIISVKEEEKTMPFCGNVSEYVITDGLDGKALFNMVLPIVRTEKSLFSDTKHSQP